MIGEKKGPNTLDVRRTKKKTKDAEIVKRANQKRANRIWETVKQEKW